MSIKNCYKGGLEKAINEFYKQKNERLSKLPVYWDSWKYKKNRDTSTIPCRSFNYTKEENANYHHSSK